MCEECSNTYKYKHNMLKHKRQHTAEKEQCELCDNTGNKINLKAHKCQHFKKIPCEMSTLSKTVCTQDVFMEVQTEVQKECRP